jgi:hypothetical protein
MTNKDERFESSEDRNKRKWQCFVCGKQHKEYEEYRTHIISEHEEGREYIKCPDCEAPVRDMPMHYKAKHPSRAFPIGIQTRVTTWFDFSASGKRKTKKPSFKRGHFISNKMNGKKFEYKSSYEEQIYKLLEADDEVVSYYYEPFRIPYCYADPASGNLPEWYDYVPDLKIHFQDGRIEVWEIKPANQTHLERNRAKWTAMSLYAEDHGWKFTVITEVGINKLKTKVKRQPHTGG